jgi:hypothetical protein
MADFVFSNSTAMGAGNVQQAVASTYKSLCVVGNSSATTSTLGAGMFRRGKIYDLLVGTNGTPADNDLEFDVAWITYATTAAGITGTLISSLSSLFGCDPADNNGCVAALQMNSTGEVGVTVVTEKWYVGLNQRASYRWVCAPGSELVYPANSSTTGQNGMDLRARSASGYTGTATGTVFFQEQ